MVCVCNHVGLIGQDEIQNLGFLNSSNTCRGSDVLEHINVSDAINELAIFILLVFIDSGEALPVNIWIVEVSKYKIVRVISFCHFY